MRRKVAAALVVAGFLLPAPAWATTVARHHCHEECDGGGSSGEGSSGGDYGHGQGGDQDGRGNCHSFCGNTIIVPSPPGMQPKGIACLVPVPYHCDPKPHANADLITNPGKIIQFPLTIFQMSVEFAQKIIKLVVVG